MWHKSKNFLKYIFSLTRHKTFTDFTSLKGVENKNLFKGNVTFQHRSVYFEKKNGKDNVKTDVMHRYVLKNI